MAIYAVFVYVLIFQIYASSAAFDDYGGVFYVANTMITLVVCQYVDRDFRRDDESETRRSSTCDCPRLTYGIEYEHAEIKKPAMNNCEYQHCVFEIQPADNSSLALTVESVLLSLRDTVRIYQYFTVNGSEIELLHCAELKTMHENYVFTATTGIGFRIHSHSYRRYYSTTAFTISFDRVGPEVQTCPYPYLVASPNFQEVPSFDRPGHMCCPFRLVSSVPGRKLYFIFNQLKSVVFDQKGESEVFFKRISLSGSRLVSATDTVDFLLTRSVSFQPKFNISYKEFIEDPCHCDRSDVIVGNTPVFVTSPGFPDLYCSNFRCRKKFLHNTTLHDNMSPTFVVTIHYMNTDKQDYLDFFIDGILLERLNGTYDDSKIVLTGDAMETEFVTDRLVTRHGFNMSVESVWMPQECTCPHKGTKVMQTQGNIQMDIPPHCRLMYCKWDVPNSYYASQFTSTFNFTSEFDTLTVVTGTDVRRFSTITGKQLKRHWKRVERTDTVILFQRMLPENYTLDSIASFSVKWMGTDDCSCDELEPQIHQAVVGEWKELTSPGYPIPYCSDLVCVDRIVAPAGHHVVLNITEFYTEPYNDVLALFDGENTTGKHIDVFHGKRSFPYLIRNENQTLSLVFKTDHDVSFDGFRMLFSAEPNDDYSPQLKTQIHASTIAIFVLVLLLIAASAVALYRRVPNRFDNPLYVPSVSYSDDASDTATERTFFG
ncbi:unnamed protein product [Cylicocyclus nassatus]|uniref:CUB domain-containing protein n=1 Tax=Cylicocyclus nassatus TaxID=53992 RepID=A0AA36GX86_CYLNA|nr:unnamed protein product [Cylicocyclus nassatus]